MTENKQPTYNPGKGAGEPVGVAILGHGTVGSEVLRLMEENSAAFAHRIGGTLEIKGVAVSDLDKPREGVDPALLTDDAVRERCRQDGFARAAQFTWEKHARHLVGDGGEVVAEKVADA